LGAVESVSCQIESFQRTGGRLFLLFAQWLYDSDIPCPILEANISMKDINDNVRFLRMVVRDRHEAGDLERSSAPGVTEKIVTTALLHRLLIRRILGELIEAEDSCEIQRHGAEPDTGEST
jgi:hypothetical protein